jgi:hypothetical protein
MPKFDISLKRQRSQEGGVLLTHTEKPSVVREPDVKSMMSAKGSPDRMRSISRSFGLCSCFGVSNNDYKERGLRSGARSTLGGAGSPTRASTLRQLNVSTSKSQTGP